MRWQDHIVATSDTLHGWPRFRNTRIPVAVVLDNLAAGVSVEELHADYPTLPKEAVAAALAYAAELARDAIVPIPAAESWQWSSSTRTLPTLLERFSEKPATTWHYSGTAVGHR